MAMATKGIEVKNMGLLIFGIILLLIGLGASFYQDRSSPFSSDWWYPYQTVGIVLVLAGIIFVASGFLYSPRKVEPKQST